MNIQSVGQLVFGFSDRPVVVQPVEEQLSTEAGLIPIRQFDERLGYTAGFAAQLRDTRVGSTHALVEMVRQRVFGILAGYADQNDHDALRSDPIFKLIAGRTADGDDLASQPTLSRMENRVTPADLLRLVRRVRSELEIGVLAHFVHPAEPAADERLLNVSKGCVREEVGAVYEAPEQRS